ncbi:ArnT family glycosyltransferase, partial [Candidatus Margulisiibacteriota bacterium]
FYSQYFSGTNMIPTGEAGYPTFFYYVAGIVLFPFSVLFGLKLGMLTLTLRLFNVIFGGLLLGLIYTFSIYLFKNRYYAFLSGLLLVSTPAFIGAIANIRPHPLELLLIFLSLYFILKAIDNYKFQYIAFSIIFAALVFATKFSGFFLLPIIAVIYFISTRNTKSLSYNDYQQKYKILTYIFSLLCIILGVTVFAGIFYVLAFLPSRQFGTTAFEQYGIIKSLLRSDTIIGGIVSGAMIFGGLFLLVLNILIAKYHRAKDSVRERFLLEVNRFAISTIGFVVVFVVVFLITNPHFIFYPLKSFIEHSRQLTWEIKSQGADKNPFLWFTNLSSNILIGKNAWIFIFTLGLSELVYLKRSWQENKIFNYKRYILAGYAIAFFIFLFFAIGRQPHHYQLPIVIIFYLLFPFVFFVLSKSQIRNWLKIAIYFILVIAIAYNVNEKIPMLNKDRKTKMAMMDDIALEYGRWLKTNINHNTSILAGRYVYIPSVFQNAVKIDNNDQIELDKNIIKYEPELIAIKDDRSEWFVSPILKAYYLQIKVFEGKTVGVSGKTNSKIYFYQKSNTQQQEDIK